MARPFRRLLAWISGTFWLLPGALVLAGIVAGSALAALDRREMVPRWLPEDWLYGGGADGARAVLGAVAASTIGVAGTVFSITITALSLASNQMGPRLLRNFTRDRGNQLTLGVFLGTFSYALMVLRTVRSADEDPFVPHLALTVGILLAFCCVGMLVFHVHHMAGRINVATVLDLVQTELMDDIRTLPAAAPGGAASGAALPDERFRDALGVTDPRRGYLQDLDAEALADWAAAQGVAIRLLATPGDYLYPGAVLVLVAPGGAVPAAAVRAVLADTASVGDEDGVLPDLRLSVRQLSEVAVRALSSGINDPNTAVAALHRLGAALHALADRALPAPVLWRGGRAVLRRDVVDYDTLTNAMFHTIRRSAADTPSALLTLLSVLEATARRERDPARLATLRRHADLVLEDGAREVDNGPDGEAVRAAHAAVLEAIARGPRGAAQG